MQAGEIPPLGKEVLAVVEHGASGRIVVSDSISYGGDRVGSDDVLLVASYSGVASFVHGLRRGVKALVGHDAGIGKEEAGVSGLRFAQKHGVPAAAVSAETAALANGRSMMGAAISRCNDAARALGVREGQNALDAARCLLAAPAGRTIDVTDAFDNSIHEVFRNARGAIYASASSFVFKSKIPDDVVCIASHAGRVFAESILTLTPRAAIANDAGMGLANSGIAGLAILNDAGVCAAAVAAMSARIGDGLSTYHDGVISALNGLAHARGVRVGMRASLAAGLMLGNDQFD
jgi:hypothetical protein